MKKVLILAYDFPPYVSVGGLRPHYWYEHFKEMGIYPVVVTRNWNPIHGNELDYIQPSETNEVVIEETDKGTLIKAPYKATLSNRLNLKNKNTKFSNLLKKVSTGWNELGQWFLPVGTKYELYKAAKSYLKENKVDVILATGEPFVLFRYASKLSNEFEIPWVADYRDIWITDKNTSSFKNEVSKIQQSRWLGNVNHIVTVSDFCKSKISQHLPQKHISIVMNGYDEVTFSKVKNIAQENEVLTISMAGTIYSWHPYQTFLEVVANVLSENLYKKIKIEFYGINIQNKIKDIIVQNPILKERIFCYPKMSNLQLLENISKSNVLLLFNYYAYMGTKIFEFLALNRKILFCFENDKQANDLKEKYYNTSAIKGMSETLQADLIKETNSGIIVKDSIHLEQVLNELFEEFETKGFIENHTVGAEKYSRKIQTEKLVELLKNIVS